ncbi:hypothetical protein ACFXDH_18790 [Streptomyces sp. NPDC059467]|uniref:hypothetical protein n=1 Tax=Streptomyces sp. NPDC059467 TaxID=3346844 RepID=UPI0036AB792B
MSPDTPDSSLIDCQPLVPTTVAGPTGPVLRPGTNSRPALVLAVVAHRSGMPSPFESPEAVNSGRAVIVQPVV